MNAPILFGLLALMLFLLSWWLVVKGTRKLRSESVAGRLGRQVNVRRTPGRIEKIMIKSGFDTGSVGLLWPSVTFAGCLLGVYALAGGLGALMVGGALLLVVRVFLGVRLRRRIRKMVMQLPAFLDHIVRSLKAGRTLPDAFELAISAAPNPLKAALGRSQRFIERGVSLEEAMGDMAAIYNIKELHLLAMAVRVNQKYGGNALEMLGNLIGIIHERDKAGRHLKAMTGETRVSALVLGILPVSLAAYVFISSPDFFMELWQDPSGKFILLISFMFQLLGSLLLWRMLRSI
ncbi:MULTISPECIES: type II secretion system F family protein [Oceanimonas]|nr:MULTISPECIES: type II secretion system F family protein [Oceanimonas]NHI02295.1 hypothetical protein [Oceanimonas sp. MB9]